MTKRKSNPTSTNNSLGTLQRAINVAKEAVKRGLWSNDEAVRFVQLNRDNERVIIGFEQELASMDKDEEAQNG